MSRYAIKFPFRVRIHGGEFDESARAIHREDGLKTIQAESGIVLESTIERKQMSTKTTFKRIALVTVAALGFGVMSVAPSNAAAPAGLTSTLSAATTAVQTGEAAKTTLTTAGIFGTGDTVTVSAALTSWPAAATNASIAGMIVPTLTAVDTDIANTVTGSNGAVNQGQNNGIISSDAAATVLLSARTTISVTPGAANTPGTYVYTITTKNDSTPAGTISTVTWTVTVAAPVLGKSTAFIGTTIGTVPTADATTLSKTLTTDGVAETTAVAQIVVNQFQDAAGTVAMNSSYTKSVEVSISGAGSVGSTSSTSALRGTTAFTAAAVAGTSTALASQDYWVYADGRSGTATITIKVDGAVVATKSFKFTGKLATLSTTASKKNVGVGETMTLTAAGADVNGNATATPTVTAKSSDATIATVTAAGEVATVTGVKAGTATITLTSGTITKDVVVTVLPVTAATLSWKFDKDSYDAGEKMTLTVTASGVADGARAVFTANPVANFGLSSGSDTVLGSPVFAAGVATYTLYAPATPGKFTITGTVNFAGVDTEAAIKTAATTYTASVASISATITNPALTAAQEATDAANEATDAGNNAKDAADQAIEAADAATIAAQDAAAAAEAAGEMAVEAAEAAGAIAQDALDAANAATDAALSAAEAADAATAAATEAKESADAATAAVAELSAEVAKLMAALTAKVTTLSTLVAKIAKKVKA
jgi:hypothetical protein